MKLKTILLATYALFLIIVLSHGTLVFAQTWTTCVVNAQTTDFVVDETNGFFSFTVISPDPGTTNTITAMKFGSSESYEGSLSPGDTVVVRYTGLTANDPVYSSGSGYLYYQGPADSVTINETEIPEFPLFLILPLFMIATLVAVIGYRRKLTS